MKQWNLDVFYTSLESNEFAREIESLKFKAEELTKFVESSLHEQGNEEAKLLYILDLKEEYYLLYYKLFIYCLCITNVDVNNKVAKEYLFRIREINSSLSKTNTIFQKWVAQLSNLEMLFKNETISEHAYFLKTIQDDAKYILSEEVEEAISKLRQSSGFLWSNLQEVLSGTSKFKIEDIELTYTEVKHLLEHKDIDKRKSAVKAMNDTFPKISRSVATALYGIQKEKTTISELRGYDSVLDQILNQIRLDKEVFDTFVTTLVEYVPKLTQYHRQKAKILGVQKIAFYDFRAPIGEVTKHYTINEAEEIVKRVYQKISDEAGEFAEEAIDNNWIDYEPRDGKVSGAFSVPVMHTDQSRIMHNYTGKYLDVVTLAHELGHAYHRRQQYGERVLNAGASMPIAETASMFFEKMAGELIIEDTTDDEKISLLNQDIWTDAFLTLWTYSEFLFEKELFNKVKQGPYDDELVCETWIRSIEKVHGDILDYSKMMKYQWVPKPHYYETGISYYNFPYTFGLLFTYGLIALYKENSESFMPKFNELLRNSGKKSILDIGKMVGIDFSNKEFWEKSLNVIVDKIDRFVELTDSALNL